MKIYRYDIELSDDNDRDYHQTGIIVTENKEKAESQIYNYYDNKTTDYVSHIITLTEIDTSKGIIIEDD